MQKQKRPTSKKAYLTPLLIGIAMLIIVVGVLETSNVTHFFHAQKVTKVTAPTASASTKGVKSSNTPTKATTEATTTSTPPPVSDTPVKNNAANTNAQLVAPWGTFVNLHSASLDTALGSTCNTTPGATCQIIFTNGTTVKALASQAADAGGAVYWTNWTPNGKNIGLTPGTWHVSAKSTLGSQTQTAEDGTDLVISS
jgi:hypothetical protein